MLIDSRLLRAFKAVAQELHFGRAAQRLHMSQPPLSLSIRQLEEHLGVVLFTRTTRNVQLTAAGAELLHRLSPIEAAHQEAVEAVQQMARGMSGELCVALTPSAAFTPIPLVLRDFRAQFTDVHLTLVEMNSRDMGQALQTGQIDLAIARPLIFSDALSVRRIYEEPLYLSVHRDDPLAQFHSVTLQEALNTPLIGYSPKDSLYFHDLIARLLAGMPQSPAPTLISMVPTILLLVESGMGTAIIPHSLTRLRGDTLRHLPIAGAEHTKAELVTVCRSSAQSPGLLRLMQMLRTQLSDLSDTP